MDSLSTFWFDLYLKTASQMMAESGVVGWIYGFCGGLHQDPKVDLSLTNTQVREILRQIEQHSPGRQAVNASRRNGQ